MYTKILKVGSDRSIGLHKLPGDGYIITGTTVNQVTEEYLTKQICLSKEAIAQLHAILVHWWRIPSKEK